MALGLIVFLVVVYTGGRSEIRLLLRVAGGAGVLVLVGAGIEIAGTASLLDIGWAEAVTETSAGMMRLLAGLLIALGLIDHLIPAQRLRSAAEPQPDPAAEAQVDDSGEVVRWAPSGASALGFCGALVGALSFGFDGHTVTEGPRVVHAVVNVVHVGAGSVWFGGVAGLAILATIRRRTGPSVAPTIIRFSSVATVALVAVTVAGVLMSLMITDGFGDYTSTDWGRLLILKTAAVGAVVALGAYNHFVVVPKLELDPDASTMLRRARSTITVEAVMLLGVAVITVFLSVASTN